ncbi:MAG: hypothetical protein KA297_11370 [Kofleriaceae bacterium]|jgi:uncharacterized protein YfaS (alpha-2-macroglobulin family)|nr:hypothetical protein [Kofleriaceae bacterium]MBP6836786.1 hypothetical protein [Kofleriaceae bacterium]
MRNRLSWVVIVGSLLGGVAVGCGSSQPPRGELTVVGTPTGETKGAVTIELGFDRPMVGPDQIGQPVAAPPLVLSPALAGSATWTDDKTLRFVPAGAPPPSTRFVATVPGATRSLDGKSLGVAASFEFSTTRLAGTLEVIGSEQRSKRDQLVKLEFDQDVDFAQVAAHCRYQGPAGKIAVKAAPTEPVGDPPAATPPEPATSAGTHTLAPASALALATDYKVVCSAGIRGVVGNLGTAEEVAVSFHTYGPLAFEGLEPGTVDIVPDEELRLSLAFSNPLAPPYQLTFDPPVPGLPQRCFDLGDDPAGLSCAGSELEARTSYTLTIGKGQRDVFGQELGQDKVVTFRTSDADPTVSLESGYFVAELTRPVIPVWTRNVSKLQVGVIAITPANFHQLSPRLDWWATEPVKLDGTKLVRREFELAVPADKNQWRQQALGAAELAGAGAVPGPGMYYVELGAPEVKEHPFEDGGRTKVLVNFTDIGVVSKLSTTRGLVWATTLSTGKPLPGATVTVRDREGRVRFTGTTDAAGLVALPGRGALIGKAASAEGEDEGEFEGEGDVLRVYVAHGKDWTMVNPVRTGGLAAWNYNVEVDYDDAPTRLRGFMHTDRGLYRPGDTVHVKGLARLTRLASPLATPGTGKPVAVTVEGPHGKTVITTKAKLSGFGGFWFDLELPGDARLGDYTIRAELEHGTFTREFSVEEYRPATFEVSGKVGQASLVRTGRVEAEVTAAYLYGAPLRSGQVKLAVHSRPRRVAFTAFPDYEFLDERQYQRWYDESEHSQSLVTEDEVALTTTGTAAVTFAVGPDDVSRDADLLIRASVTAPSEEVISKTFTVPYFRSTRYFGVKSPGYFLEVKKPQRFAIVGVGPDGKPADGPAKVSVSRRDWNCVWEDWGYRGSYQCQDKSTPVLDTTVQLTGGAPGTIEFTPAEGGEYLVMVEGVADKDSASTAAVSLYAWGDGGGSWRSSDAMSFEVVADKREYQAGDTATLLLKTDLSSASGLVTIERDGVIESRPITVDAGHKHVTVPISAAYAPNVYVSVALVQGRMGDGPRGKPRMRMGVVNLPVRPADNRLSVAVSTDAKDYRPGAPVTATVRVTDAAGKPVSAEVAITAADEGVLSLIGYTTPDPVPTFYAPWGLGVTSSTQLEYLRDIPGPNVARPATGGDAAGTMRSRFVASAVWAPGAVTNSSGVATVKFAAPDNLTAFRVMAVAADRGERFGSGDQRFTVSKPLQLLAALPRFVNVGDTVSAGVVVHNETGAAGTATVTMTSDARLQVAASERTVAVAAGAAVPVMFDLRGAEVGTASVTFSVQLGRERDGLAVSLPVQHPSPIETTHLATGATQGPFQLPVAMPAGALPGTIELAISVDPDGLAGVEEGLRDLVGYPYGCLEQTTSKVIPMLAARDLADSLDLSGLPGGSLDGFVKAGVAKIGRFQTASGGYSLWVGGEADPYYTAYALWGLHLAKQAGYRVDADRLGDGLRYLRDDDRSEPDGEVHNPHGDAGSRAFALYVRAVLGDPDTAAATKMLAQADALPIYGQAFLARALAAGLGPRDPAVAGLVAKLAARATAATASGGLVAEPREADLDWYMSSSIRTTAVVLAALVELDPKNAAVAPLVAALMKARRAEPYLDTQENLYGLLALTSYARTLAGTPPSLTVAVFGKEVFAGTLAGKGRIRTFTVPVDAAAAAAGAVTITPRGQVHYAVDLRARREVAALKGVARGGMTLQREYLDERGVATSTFKVGDVVVVRLSATVPDDSHHLMVSDPLPAGFEPLNTRLVTVGTAGVTETESRSWRSFREMHDDRIDFAAEYPSRGKTVYEYSMRAIAAGTFTRPPAVAELMYEPAVGAQTPADTLVISPR